MELIFFESSNETAREVFRIFPSARISFSFRIFSNLPNWLRNEIWNAPHGPNEMRNEMIHNEIGMSLIFFEELRAKYNEMPMSHNATTMPTYRDSVMPYSVTLRNTASNIMTASGIKTT